MFAQIPQDSTALNEVVNKEKSIVVMDSTDNEQENDASEESYNFKMQKSTTKAIVYSLIFPGLGQVYTENYWKVPIFAGAAGTLVYFIADNWSKYNGKVDEIAVIDSRIDDLEMQISLIEENGEDVPSELTYALSVAEDSLDLQKRWKELYRDNRDLSGLYLMGVYLIATVDAYAGAHLFDFNVDENLAFAVLPNIRRGVTLNLYYKF